MQLRQPGRIEAEFFGIHDLLNGFVVARSLILLWRAGELIEEPKLHTDLLCSRKRSCPSLTTQHRFTGDPAIEEIVRYGGDFTPGRFDLDRRTQRSCRDQAH